MNKQYHRQLFNRIVLFIVCLNLFTSAYSQRKTDWCDQAVTNLMSRLTNEQKISLLMNSSPSIDSLGIRGYNCWNEGLHGVASVDGVTVFPQAIGLAASWNPSLIYKVADAISTEGRILWHNNRIGGLSFWSPNINIFRDPRWGRGQETYGEDPFLTSQLAFQFISAFQGNDNKYYKLIATPKHYAVHSGPEYVRHHFDVEPTDVDLWDTYLPAFRTAIVDAKAYSIMGAYNRVDGIPACANTFLLDTVLRKKWKFEGYVVSDCEAITDIWKFHKYEPSDAIASSIAVKAGCDLECGVQYVSLTQALEDNLLTQEELDLAVFRVLKARFLLGEFEKKGKVSYEKYPYSQLDSEEHRKLAETASRESIVLLKNNEILPLSGSQKSIALLGPNASDHRVLYGNYNGWPSRSVSLLDGMKAEFGVEKINYIEGAPLVENVLTLVNSSFLTSLDNRPGLTAEYFDNDSLSGKPVVTKIDSCINFVYYDKPLPQLPADKFSIRWSGFITPETSGWYSFGLSADDGLRFYFDDELVIDDWKMGGESLLQSEHYMEAGKKYPIKIEYYDWMYRGTVSFKWGKQFLRTPQFEVLKTKLTDKNVYSAQLLAKKDAPYNFKVTGRGKYSLKINGAEIQSELLEDRNISKYASIDLKKGETYNIRLESTNSDLVLEYGEMDINQKDLDVMVAEAAKSDVIVFAGGISPLLESEEGQTLNTDGFSDGDKLNLDLPRVQKYLLYELHKTGKPVVFVMMNGSCISLNWENQNLDAILTAWYPGEEGGNAIASVLSGKYNPAGRLPVTFYKEIGDLSTFLDYSMKDKTYRYIKTEPLYPFGYGLSYTQYAYDKLELADSYQFKSENDSISFSCRVTNTGDRDGNEVVQVYISDSTGKSKGINKSLRAFKRVFIPKGESRTVTLSIKLSDLKQYIIDKQEVKFVPDNYKFEIGASSSDIRLFKNCQLSILK